MGLCRGGTSAWLLSQGQELDRHPRHADQDVEALRDALVNISERLAADLQRLEGEGLGLIGPIFPGVAASSLAGLALGLDTRALARWMSVGSALLYAVYTLFWWAVAALF